MHFQSAARPLAYGLVIVLAILSSAADARAEEPVDLDRIIVTAGLEPLAARDVASSVTVFTREDIERRQARTLTELLRDVPGFAVSQAGGPGTQTQVRVRGAEANHVLVLVDGVRANDPAGNDEFPFQYASTADIERIEIVRGPQSAIWGTDALAGVINIIYRKDVETDYSGGHAEYGSFDTIDAGVEGGMRRGNLHLKGSVSHRDTDGSNIARIGHEDDGAEVTTAVAAVAWDASDALRLDLSVQGVEAENDFDGSDFVETGLPADADLRTEASRRSFRGDARWEPPGGRWTHRLSAGWLDTDNDNFASGTRTDSTSAESLELALKSSVLLGDTDAAAHRLTFALDHEDVDFTQRGAASPFGDPNQDQSYTVTGYAAEYVGRPLERFTWTLNGRLDDFSDFDDAFTWQLAASHGLSERWRLRGSVGTGSKAPTFIERFGFFPDLFVGNPDLEPETSRGYELGVDAELFERAGRVSFAYFHQKLEDEIEGFVFDPATGFFTARNRDGDSRRKGVEAVLDVDIGQALTVSASYTYTDAEEAAADGADRQEIRRPRHAASLHANYRFASDRGNLNLGINHSGEQLDNFFPPPFFAAETVTLEAYTVVDLAASWRLTESLELTGRVENLFDEDYEEILGFVRPGRAVFVGLRMRVASGPGR